jgi:hypothetical protein
LHLFPNKGKRVYSKKKGPHKAIMALAFTLHLKITCMHFLTRGVSQCGLAIFTKKYLKAKHTQIFYHAKIQSSKNPLKKLKSFKIL